MVQRGFWVASGEACKPTLRGEKTGEYFAYGYLLGRGAAVRRERISLGVREPGTAYPAFLASEVLRRIGTKLERRIATSSLVALAVNRLCWHEGHGLPMDRPARVERVANIAVASTALGFTTSNRMRFEQSDNGPDIGTVNVPLRHTNTYVDRPVVYLPVTPEEANYPISHLAQAGVPIDGLPPAYVALRDRLSGAAQLVIRPDELQQ